MIDELKIFKKIQGCIHGLASGDAIGYVGEFNTVERRREMPSIVSRGAYGPDGVITRYPREDGIPNGLYSDDTQMTLAVADGLLDSQSYDVDEVMKNVSRRFVEWNKSPDNNRAPGFTCTGGAANLEKGIPWRKSGLNSYTCGSAMRVAPIGVLFYKDLDKLKEISEASAISTHNHPTSIASATAAAYLVARVMDDKDPRNVARVVEFTAGISDDFTEKIRQVDEVMGLDYRDALHKLGAGWNGHEAVAAALYCVKKNGFDFEKTVLMAANTDGDSDSIACIAGGIVGAYVGYDNIPVKFLRGLENRNLLFNTGKRLHQRVSRDN